jgi:cupin 2 domain-containing protein
MPNLFTNLPDAANGENFTEILSRPGVRIERIVTLGQRTPADTPYRQAHDEWVLLLTGEADLWIEGEADVTLRPGDHVFIPANRPHGVTRTPPDEATIWLAVHFR